MSLVQATALCPINYEKPLDQVLKQVPVWCSNLKELTEKSRSYM